MHHLRKTSSGRRVTFSRVSTSDHGSEPGTYSASPPSPSQSAMKGHPRARSNSNTQKVDDALVSETKKSQFVVRTVWTLLMIAGFFAAMALGHLWIIGLVTAVQVFAYKEIIAIPNVPSREARLPWSRTQDWYFLAVTMYYLDGESVIYYLKHILLVDSYFVPLAQHHRFISFTLYILGIVTLWSQTNAVGFVFFVSNLKKGHYRFQFAQFCWTHMALLLVVVQAHFIVNNIFEGMIWFFLPVCLVVTNDIFAYICGITFGRTPLIKISPKKTVEGFIGAWICTVVFGGALVNILMQYDYMICPVTDLTATAFSGHTCNPNAVFRPHTFALPQGLHYFGNNFTVAPVQFHILAMATFASLIAPFGGFFASGLKRTFKIKDFGDTIPGHGGVMDRMDCQFIMGFFSHVYYQSFIAEARPMSVGGILELALTSLTYDDQVELVHSLTKHLRNQGLGFAGLT